MARPKKRQSRKASTNNEDKRSQTNQKSAASAAESSISQSDKANTTERNDSDAKEGNAYSKTGINDPTWYTKFPELAYGAGNLPFGDTLGNQVRYTDLTHQWTNPSSQVVRCDPNILHNDAIPGICSVVTKPSYGFNVDLNDPLNVAATQYYANVRYVNSGRKNYDAPDLMIATQAIADLYSFINWAQRLYGYAFMYSMRNKYINAALIEANHVNSTDIVEKLANFRYWLNSFIARVSAFAVPASINIFQRRAFMYAHLYTESSTNNTKDQLYQFVPDGFYKFQLDSTGKGMLKYIPMEEFAATQWTINNIMAFGELLLSNISGDEDFGLMTGDIIKAYGSNIISLSPVPEALIIPAEYEEYTLSQMRNAHICNSLQRGSNARQYHIEGNNDEVFTAGDVMQANNGNLITAEGVDPTVFSSSEIYCSMAGIITVTNPMPSIEDVLEATRLVTCAWPTAEDKLKDGDLSVIVTGSDVVTKWIMSDYGWADGVWKLIQYNVTSQFSVSTQPSSNKEWLAEHFHWAPMNFIYTATASSETGVDYDFREIHVMSNVDNYTSLSWQNVVNLHETALISLLSVPGVATLVG